MTNWRGGRFKNSILKSSKYIVTPEKLYKFTFKIIFKNIFGYIFYKCTLKLSHYLVDGNLFFIQDQCTPYFDELTVFDWGTNKNYVPKQLANGWKQNNGHLKDEMFNYF